MCAAGNCTHVCIYDIVKWWSNLRELQECSFANTKLQRSVTHDKVLSLSKWLISFEKKNHSRKIRNFIEFWLLFKFQSYNWFSGWLRSTWVDSGWLELTPVDFSWLGLTQVDLGWLGLTWVDLGWLGLTWVDFLSQIIQCGRFAKTWLGCIAKPFYSTWAIFIHKCE